MKKRVGIKYFLKFFYKSYHLRLITALIALTAFNAVVCVIEGIDFAQFIKWELYLFLTFFISLVSYVLMSKITRVSESDVRSISVISGITVFMWVLYFSEMFTLYPAALLTVVLFGYLIFSLRAIK